jgi:multimeric flavodoxin WrbA
MFKKILILLGSPKKNGNTAYLVKWFTQGARTKGARIEIINTSFLKYKSTGCNGCGACQKLDKYECVIKDQASQVLKKMALADVVVMATPLYFYSPSAQSKLVMDRMFCLYKYDDKTKATVSPLNGKTLILIASAFEDIGLDILKKTFAFIADYSDMKFQSLLIPNAGDSGNIKNNLSIRKKVVAFGKKTV